MSRWFGHLAWLLDWLGYGPVLMALRNAPLLIAMVVWYLNTDLTLKIPSYKVVLNNMKQLKVELDIKLKFLITLAVLLCISSIMLLW